MVLAFHPEKKRKFEDKDRGCEPLFEEVADQLSNRLIKCARISVIPLGFGLILSFVLW